MVSSNGTEPYKTGGHDEKTQSILMILSLPIAVMSASAAQVPQHSKQPIHTITNQRGRSNHKAINYQHRNASTTIDLHRTPLMPAGTGHSKTRMVRKTTTAPIPFGLPQCSESVYEASRRFRAVSVPGVALIVRHTPFSS